VSEYEERHRQFGEEFEDFAPSEVLSLFTATGRWLDMLAQDRDAVTEAMLVLHRRLFSSDHRLDDDWQTVWDARSATDAIELPLSQKFTSAFAFAHYGLNPVDGVPPSERESEIGNLITSLRQFLSAVPDGWASLTDIENCILAAEARFAIDTGKPVTANQLAALAGMQIKSFKNLLMPSSGSGLRESADGTIPAESALRWLLSRSSFKSSLWREAQATSDAVSEAEAELDDDIVFVPVDNEGNWFDPIVCRRAGTYTVGAKGHEVHVSDYREAVALLAKMKIPRWRRPNSKGHWGIVRARDERWMRRTVSDRNLSNGSMQS
jgi:hypothetical protein